MALGERRWYGGKVDWSGELVQKMRDLRGQGLSRREIGERYVHSSAGIACEFSLLEMELIANSCSLSSLQIAPEQQRLISRVAPQSREQASAKVEEFAEHKAKWGYRKRLAREVRQKRKEFW